MYLVQAFPQTELSCLLTAKYFQQKANGTICCHLAPFHSRGIARIELAAEH